jgi:hypothetical protein
MNVEMQNPILRNIASLGSMDTRINPTKVENHPSLPSQNSHPQNTALFLPRPPLFSLEQFSAMFSMVVDLFKSFMSMIGEMGFSPPKPPEVVAPAANQTPPSPTIKPTAVEAQKGPSAEPSGIARDKGLGFGDIFKSLLGLMTDKIGGLFKGDGKSGSGLLSIFGDLFGSAAGLLGGGLFEKGLGSLGGIFKGLKKLF